MYKCIKRAFTKFSIKYNQKETHTQTEMKMKQINEKGHMQAF